MGSIRTHALRVAARLGACACIASALDAQPAALASFDSAWAAVSRTYWDADLLNGRWRATHDSLRSGLGAAPTDDAVRSAIRALIAVPQQSHFALIPGSAVPTGGRAAREPGTTGIDPRMIDGTLVVWRVAAGSVADRAGVRPGDRLVRIDSMVVDSVRTKLLAASDGDARKADHLLATFAIGKLAGGLDQEVTLHVVDRAARTRVLVLARSAVAGTVTRYGNLPPFVVDASLERLPSAAGAKPIGVLRFNGWFPVLLPVLDSMLFGARDVSALIIDLRGNPGGVIGMIAGMSGHMLDSARSLGELKSRTGTIRFTANPRVVDRRNQRVEPFGGPVAILVDEFSASTSEFFATGMQAIGRAKVFGTRSAGMALPAAMGRLPNGDVLMHVIADHVDPAGRRVEGVGIAPDVPTPLTLADLREGRDAALEAARAWIAAGAK